MMTFIECQNIFPTTLSICFPLQVRVFLLSFIPYILGISQPLNNGIKKLGRKRRTCKWEKEKETNTCWARSTRNQHCHFLCFLSSFQWLWGMWYYICFRGEITASEWLCSLSAFTSPINGRGRFLIQDSLYVISTNSNEWAKICFVILHWQWWMWKEKDLSLFMEFPRQEYWSGWPFPSPK